MKYNYLLDAGFFGGYFIGIMIVALTIYHSSYFLDAILLSLGLLVLKHYRDKWHISTLGYYAAITAMVIHSLGVFGAYSWTIFGLTYDVYMHFASGFASGIILHNILPKKMVIHKNIMILILVLGLNAVGELVEFGGTLANIRHGMFGIEGEIEPTYGLSIDYWDTMTDFIRTIEGGIAAIILTRFRGLND